MFKFNAYKENIFRGKNIRCDFDTLELAEELYYWLKRNGLWLDVTMYFGGVAACQHKSWGYDNGERLAEDLYLFEGKDPRDYFDYVRSENILSMSFEGPLYDVLNAYCGGWEKLEAEFNEIFYKHGLYPQMGNAWNLTAYRKED